MMYYQTGNGISHQMVGAVWMDQMPLHRFLSAFICVYLRFQLHGSG
jgi:hypothetical protein